MMVLKRAIASIELILVLPAVLFMMALFTRSAFPPATVAAAVITWYAGRMWTLWVLLLGLPFAALVIGCSTLVRSWRDDDAFRHAVEQTIGAVHAHVAMLLVAVATTIASTVLVIVVLHMAAN